MENKQIPVIDPATLIQVGTWVGCGALRPSRANDYKNQKKGNSE